MHARKLNQERKDKSGSEKKEADKYFLLDCFFFIRYVTVWFAVKMINERGKEILPA